MIWIWQLANDDGRQVAGVGKMTEKNGRRFGVGTRTIAIAVLLGVVVFAVRPETARAQGTQDPDGQTTQAPSATWQPPTDMLADASSQPTDDRTPTQGHHLGTPPELAPSRTSVGDVAGPLGDAVAAAAPGFYTYPFWLPVAEATVFCAQMTTECGDHHGYPAVDFFNSGGEPLTAWASGAGQAFIVSNSAACDVNNPWENSRTLAIVHRADGGLVSFYGNLQSIEIADGQWVDQNTLIGTFGSDESGPCPSSWLHFAIYDYASAQWVGPNPLFACHGPNLFQYPDDAGYTTWDTAFGLAVSDEGVRCAYSYCNGVQATIDMNWSGVGTGTPGNDVIVGTPGADSIQGGAGDDLICGGDGNDTIVGEAGRDWIDAGAGNDIVFGGSEIDRIFGRSGADTINGDGGSDRIWAGSGDDTVNAGSGADRVFGGPGDDTLNGQGGQDFMRGDGGNDTIQGNHQSDELYGGPGNDVIRGAAGRDVIFGDAGNDRMFGGDNTDYLDGGPGTDHADGQRGKDNPLITNRSGCRAEVRVSC